MSVLVCGLNYRSAPIALLEKLAVPGEQLPKALYSLTSRTHVSEAVILSTCNRVEVYAHVSRYHGGMADIRNHFAEWAGVPPDDLVDVIYDHYDESAFDHLFRVASGLDSMVVGERQIQLQVKQAFADAQAEGAASRLLRSLFENGLRVGKRARAETGICKGASSMVDVGLQAAERTLGDVDGKSVLIIGAGKMGGMVARRLSDRAGRVQIANRTVAKRARLAERVGAQELDIADLEAGLAEADLVVSSTGAAYPLVDHDLVAASLQSRAADRPLVFVDLAVPRDVGPDVAELPGVTVLDVDAIRKLTDTGVTGVEVDKAKTLVAGESERFAARARELRVGPTIAGIRSYAEGVRQAEVAKRATKLTGLDPQQRELVEALTKGLVNSLLHEPTVRLKQVAEARGGEGHATVLQELFGLPEAGDPGAGDPVAGGDAEGPAGAFDPGRE